MKAYSIDLRQRIVAAVERGMSRSDVATTFGVSLSTIKRLLARQRREFRVQWTELMPNAFGAELMPNAFGA